MTGRTGPRHPWLRVAPLAVLAFAATDARAGCAKPYTLDGLLGDLGTVEDSLRQGNDAGAAAAAKNMESNLACLNEVLPVMIVGRTFRAIAAGKVAGGDTSGGSSWFVTAAEVEQAFVYGLEDLPADHPIRGLYEDARFAASGEVVSMEGMAFTAGDHFVDGRKVSEPKARLDRPHLYQMSGGGQVLGWVISGNGFPPDVLTQADAVADAAPDDDEATVVGGKAPKPKPVKEPKPGKVADDEPEKEPKPGKDPKGKTMKGQASDDGTMVVRRQRPWEKTPLMIGGAAIIAGSGGLYAAAAASRNKFDNATTLEDITRLQSATNQLVIISAATLAVGAGTLTWGVILDGSGAPIPALSVRF